MKAAIEPVCNELVFIGGGHTHAIALRMLGMKPLSGVRLTVISESSESAYSGMMPGRIAGFYSDVECHVNLAALATFAGAQLYVDRVTGLDLINRQVICDRHPPVAFDVLSIDIGSTPSLPSELAGLEYILPVKPVRQFFDRWDEWVDRIIHHPNHPVRLAIVGGGAAGVELAFTMQHRIHQILQAANQPLTHLELHLIHRGAQLVPQFNHWIQNCLHSLLLQRNIHLHLNQDVQTIADHIIECKSGLKLACDAIVWSTRASPASWLQHTGLALDDAGFIHVHDTLQSVSHPNIFAAGDIATMVNHPRPKAGVFAVRQGKPLVENLRRYVQQRSLKPFHPQKHYLSLMNTADGQAIGVRGWWGWRSPLLWVWKDQIDRRFMQRLNQLPEMGEQSGVRHPRASADGSQESGVSRKAGNSLLPPLPPLPTSPMPCAGCGSKVGSSILHRVLQRIQPHTSSSVLIGLQPSDDAAVIQVSSEKVIVQTIDYFTALIHDPFVFGQISTNHALSDLYAMGAMPHSGLAIATVPYGSEACVEESLYQLLSGAVKILQEAGAVLIGGHSTEGAELAFGLSCNGQATSDRLLRKAGLQPGQALILTKPLGTGTLFAATMRKKALGRWIDAAVESMLRSNQAATHCFLQYEAAACTDITGFGLIGHLMEMVRASPVAIKLELDAIPVLDGALTTIAQGIFSSLHPQNLQASQFIANLSDSAHHPKFPLLFDPQTSGGLLAAIPIATASDCLHQLHQSGYPHSATIGYTLPAQPDTPPITIVK